MNEKDLTQNANGHVYETGRPSASVFEVIHSLASGDMATMAESNQQNLLDQPTGGTASIACNPLLLSIPNYDQTTGGMSANDVCHVSSGATSLNDSEFHSSMHINRMFDEANEYVIILIYRSQKEKNSSFEF